MTTDQKLSVISLLTATVALKESARVLADIGETGALAATLALITDYKRILGERGVTVIDMGEIMNPRPLTLEEHKAARRKRDLDKIETGKWPMWPLLAMKRIRDTLATGPIAQFGVLVTSHEGYGLAVVRDGTVFNSLDQVLGADVIAEYESVEDMLDDGWTVD
jgi:hypothetical protein